MMVGLQPKRNEKMHLPLMFMRLSRWPPRDHRNAFAFKQQFKFLASVQRLALFLICLPVVTFQHVSQSSHDVYEFKDFSVVLERIAYHYFFRE